MWKVQAITPLCIITKIIANICIALYALFVVKYRYTNTNTIRGMDITE